MPSFTVDDPVLGRFRSLLTRLQTRVFGSYNPTLRAHDLHFSAALAARHGSPNSRAGALADELSVLTERINRTRASTLEALLSAALHREPTDKVIEAANNRFADIVQALEGFETRLRSSTEFDTVSIRGETFAPGSVFPSKTYRNFAAAAALVFVMSGTTGCKHASSPASDTASGAPSETETIVDTEIIYDTEITGDSATTDDTATIGDTSFNNDSDTPGDTEISRDSEAVGDTNSESGSASDDCAADERREETNRLSKLVLGNCYLTPGSDVLEIVIGSDGKVQSVLVPDSARDDTDLSMLIGCFQDILKDEEFPCLAGEEVWVTLPPIKVIA